MRRFVKSLGVLLVACYWLAAGPLVPALQVRLCRLQHGQMAGMPSGPCYCSHMASSIPAAPTDAVVPPVLATLIRTLPDAPATVPVQLPSRPSPTYPPEPPPPNAVA